MYPEEEIKIGDLVKVIKNNVPALPFEYTGYGIVVYIFFDVETGYQVHLSNGRRMPFARDELTKVA
tara:strand:+ start:95 stop:292 length:198 start_codon:yes stop_codon:yes gene_type:complete